MKTYYLSVHAYHNGWIQGNTGFEQSQFNIDWAQIQKEESKERFYYINGYCRFLAYHPRTPFMAPCSKWAAVTS